MNHKAEEEVIGVSGSRAHMDEIEVITSGVKRFRCPKCLKNVHSIAGYNKGEDIPSLLKVRCTTPDCECICKTHFMGKDGKMRLFGTKDNSFVEGYSQDKERTATDDMIDLINLQYKRDHK